MLSFIIPAHNEASLLGDTLDALRAAAAGTGLPYELVVVDDASDDGSGGVAHAHGARVVRVEHRHIAAARNAGARAATGETLVFVDADTRVDARVLDAALRALDDGAVGGGAAVRLAGTPQWHVRIVTRLLMVVFRWTGIAPGCFLFCTRAAFDAAGGFDQAWYAGEDVALSRSLARQGRFAILREAVHTSDRKLRTFGAREHFLLMLRFIARGRSLLRSREHLDLWYVRRSGPKP